ncbi:Alpha/Beta hydrolase protein [Aspergillus caelatus]|uniref:Alpha/Beta hydrolase protein n=1 Tax=Aspergillus caelatus TaxID=61420 RepID=A0A5N6ZRV3_9EURO|nr:Alpha/Beta hydrolase protein [Aspergillus caelatus]KAE8360304.1 Alpha/Beta hydrolase protein [Aspergillus caelatus]
MLPSLPAGGRTLVYSTVDGHDIKLDYYLPAVEEGCLPAVIYYHGGGMTAGSRRSIGFQHWLYGEGFQQALPEAISLDTSRIAVTGFSAGAYSARAACVYATPKPAVLLTGYGSAGDWLLDHWTTGRPPTSIAKFVDLNKVPKLLADKTVVSDDTPESGIMSNRFALTVRWELDGTFLDGSIGRPGLGAELNKLEYAQRATAIPEDLKPAFLQLFVTENYPPSVFVHGTADEVVPDQESKHHHEQLKQVGVKTELLLVENGPHGLVDFSSGMPPGPAKGSVEAYDRAFEFVTEVFDAVK